MFVLILILGIIGSISSQAYGKPMPMNITSNVHNCRNCTQAASGELENDLEFDLEQMIILDKKVLVLNGTLENVKSDILTMDGRLNTVETELVHINERLDKMEKRLDKMEMRLDKMEKNFDSRLNEMDIKIKSLLDRMDKLLKETSPPKLQPNERESSLKAEKEFRQHVQILSPHFGVNFGDAGVGDPEVPFLDCMSQFAWTCSKIFGYFLQASLLGSVLFMLLAVLVTFLVKFLEWLRS